MIKIVAIRTAIGKKNYASKTIVNFFQLVYAVAVLLIIVKLNKTPQQLFDVCVFILFGLFIVRLILARLQKICGDCREPLEKSNRIACPECGNYNVYDLKLWSKLEYKSLEVVRRAEIGRVVQNILALTIVLLMFASPVLYFFIVIEDDIYQVNQQRRKAFSQIRPALLRYKAENHTFPNNLVLLLPDYMDEIPGSLIDSAHKDKVLKIDYQADKESAKFVFYTSRVPGAMVSYEITEDQYRFESILAQLRW